MGKTTPSTSSPTHPKLRNHPPDGHCYIDAIPMIDQGEKGYCAAATLARILQYYGYPISMHAIGELAQTTAEGATMIRSL